MELKSKTKEGRRLERGTRKGLNPTADSFAQAINFDGLAEALKDPKVIEILKKVK